MSARWAWVITAILAIIGFILPWLWAAAKVHGLREEYLTALGLTMLFVGIGSFITVVGMLVWFSEGDE